MHRVLFACGFLKDRLGLELPGALCVVGPRRSVARGRPPSPRSKRAELSLY